MVDHGRGTGRLIQFAASDRLLVPSPEHPSFLPLLLLGRQWISYQLTMQQPADVTGVTDTDQRGNGNGDRGVGKILGGKSSHIARL